MWSYNRTPYNQLMHYGILGMKWGVRRSDAQLKRATGKAQSDPKPKPKSVRDMSNEDLDSAITRLRKEKDFADLSRQVNPEKVSTGKRFVSNFKSKMADKGAEVASSVAQEWMKKKGMSLLGLDSKKSEEDKMMEDLMKKHNFLKTVSAMYTYSDNIKKKASESGSEGKKPEWADWTMDDVAKSDFTNTGSTVVNGLLKEKDK